MKFYQVKSRLGALRMAYALADNNRELLNRLLNMKEIIITEDNGVRYY